MDNDGKRLIARYYTDDFPTVREQKVRLSILPCLPQIPQVSSQYRIDTPKTDFVTPITNENFSKNPLLRRFINKYYHQSGTKTSGIKVETIGQGNFTCINIFLQAFEKKIFDKTKKRDDEILLLDGYSITYKTNVDLMFYVIGSQEENELLLTR